ncbi:MAG TPA: M28 family metallopeptidase, partial [Thermoanaerobaculia bacterium]|nr:M28 family metallopeptidase [Thermoanaerobaculia bacterium]
VVESECSMSLSRNGRKTNLRYGKDFISDYVAEQDSSVTAPVVFAGFSITAPELKHDDYAGIDARGKIVAFLMGVPKSFPEPHKTWYRSRRLQIQNALDHGAVGILVIPTPETQKRFSMETLLQMTRRPALIWADEAGRPGPSRPEMRGAAFLSGRGIKKLFAGAPRSLEEVYKTAEAGQPQGFDLPVQASLRTVSRRESTGSSNVAAVLRGSDPKLRDEYVVVTAHLDHVGVDEPVKGDAIYNGAYDNAAGVASLLEMANAFSRLPTPPRRSVLFVALTAEEKGLYGSDYFVRYPTVPFDRIVANLNLDMYLMLFPLKDVVAFGAEYSSIGPTLEKATSRLGIKLTPDPLPEENIFMRSDQFSFVKKGIPSVYLMSGIETSDPSVNGLDVLKRWLEEVYHQPNDDMNQKMDFEAGAQFTRINFLLTWMMAQEDEAPRWTPGNFFGDKFGPRIRQ